MKRFIIIMAALAAFVTLTVSAQAESAGEQIFDQKCAMCHIIKGKKGGAIGPELTGIASRMKESDIRAQLENPRKKNPSTSMPSFKTLPSKYMTMLLSYLNTLK